MVVHFSNFFYNLVNEESVASHCNILFKREIKPHVLGLFQLTVNCVFSSQRDPGVKILVMMRGNEMPRCYDGSETFLGRVTHRDIRDTCVTCHVLHIPQLRARCYNQTMKIIVSDTSKFKRLYAFKYSLSDTLDVKDQKKNCQ